MACPKGAHPGRYNEPTSPQEVAVIIEGSHDKFREISLVSRAPGDPDKTISKIINPNSTLIQRQTRELRIPNQCSKYTTIVETHRSYDSLQYPLKFIYGENGYDISLLRQDGKSLSCKDYYSYRFMTRRASNDATAAIEYNHILNCRQLLNQFAVDVYAKMESERMWFIRNNQTKLRAESYKLYHDALANDEDPQNIGKRVILPSSYMGSPRHMHEYSQDGMAYCRLYGCPDLFITFTCNKNWIEITEQLYGGQEAHERHDIIARVFKLKQDRFIDLIVKQNLFGEVKAWLYTIEWQKRGNPHSHNLIWLKDKIPPNQIDSIISAELPDPIADPVIFKIVQSCMIHTPCTDNTKAACYKIGEPRCAKKFPRDFVKETQHGDDGYPTYRRRSPTDGGFTGKVKMYNKEIMVDNNSWVVPYNPVLLRIFDAHINVEYCHSVKSIKYICKYVHKGSDRTMFKLSNEVDAFCDGRYISTNEAFWRIFAFPIHNRFPSVLHLTVHLENEHTITFNPVAVQAGTSANEPGICKNKSTLIPFFDLCRRDEFAKTIMYADVGLHYTWDPKECKFERRKNKSFQIGRVYVVHPKESERFYLRLLLHKIPGPTSYEYLRTVNGVLCETFQQACQELGLLESDNHWNMALKEASEICHPKQIRDLFAVILTAGIPSNPNELWLTHRESMSEDLLDLNIEAVYTNDVFNRALVLIEDKCIEISNTRLKDLSMLAPDRTAIANTSLQIMLNPATIALQKSTLNDDQRLVYETVMERIRSETGGVFFLDAPGGTGKTFLMNLIISEVQLSGGEPIAVESSGIHNSKYLWKQ